MLSSLWQQSRALTATAAIMLLALLFSLIGIVVDPRVITGMPAWLKPAKFALSSAIYAASIAWLFRYLPDFPKTKSWTGGALAAILLLEVGIIDFQAARGRTSHFNVSTVEDAILFTVMGTAIGILWLLSVWVLITLFRQPFQDAVWGWALRLGMLISVLGLASGGLMVTPTAQQKAMARYERVTVSGAHTVGAPDGGPGIPGVGWSKEHGDLRIPHFLGQHALQIVPLIVWWRRRAITKRFVFAISGSYLALYLILSWQALRGESIVEPTTLTLTVLAMWFIATALALIPWERNGFGMRALHER